MRQKQLVIHGFIFLIILNCLLLCSCTEGSRAKDDNRTSPLVIERDTVLAGEHTFGSGIHILKGATLTLRAGAILKFTTIYSTINNDGTLLLHGQKNKKISILGCNGIAGEGDLDADNCDFEFIDRKIPTEVEQYNLYSKWNLYIIAQQNVSLSRCIIMSYELTRRHGYIGTGKQLVSCKRVTISNCRISSGKNTNMLLWQRDRWSWGHYYDHIRALICATESGIITDTEIDKFKSVTADSTYGDSWVPHYPLRGVEYPTTERVIYIGCKFTECDFSTNWLSTIEEVHLLAASFIRCNFNKCEITGQTGSYIGCQFVESFINCPYSREYYIQIRRSLLYKCALDCWVDESKEQHVPIWDSIVYTCTSENSILELADKSLILCYKSADRTGYISPNSENCFIIMHDDYNNLMACRNAITDDARIMAWFYAKRILNKSEDIINDMIVEDAFGICKDIKERIDDVRKKGSNQFSIPLAE